MGAESLVGRSIAGSHTVVAKARPDVPAKAAAMTGVPQVELQVNRHVEQIRGEAATAVIGKRPAGLDIEPYGRANGQAERVGTQTRELEGGEITAPESFGGVVLFGGVARRKKERHPGALLKRSGAIPLLLFLFFLLLLLVLSPTLVMAILNSFTNGSLGRSSREQGSIAAEGKRSGQAKHAAQANELFHDWKF